MGPQPRNWPKFTAFDRYDDLDGERVIVSLGRRNWGIVALASLCFTFNFSAITLTSWATGVLLDSGLEAGLTAALVPGLLLLLGIVCAGAISTLFEVVNMTLFLRVQAAVVMNLVRRVSGVRGGGRQRIPSGEVVSGVSSDSQKAASLFYQIPNTIAAIITFILVTVLMLNTSVVLGLLVAIGMPIVVALVGFIMIPLQKRLETQRAEKGKLTTLGSDAVVGLRVLRGVGGEQVYLRRYTKQSEELQEAGIRTSRWQALISMMFTTVPAVFTTVVICVGLVLNYRGEITTGQLVAFYGYTGSLAIPVFGAFQFFFALADAKVAAKRIRTILALDPLTSDDAVSAESRAAAQSFDWSSADLFDSRSGVHVRSGEVTALVAAHPDVSAAQALRLARVDDEDAEVYAQAGEQRLALRSVPLDLLRTKVVLSDAIAQLFQGRLRSNLAGRYADVPVARNIARQVEDTGDGAGIAHRDHALNPDAPDVSSLNAAMFVADAKDVASQAEGYDLYVEERGRSLSGGQRQRVALARAILTDAPILVLVEPTSAVDSHTEARIAQRLHAERLDRTTVVVSASPLVLDSCDRVLLLSDDGEVLAQGTHAELLHDSRYHGIVNRASGADDESQHSDDTQHSEESQHSDESQQSTSESANSTEGGAQ